MNTVKVKVFKVTQKVTYEYGRFSALPHHRPTRVVEAFLTTESVYQVPACTSSGFQRMNPETNRPPETNSPEVGVNCYVSYSDFSVEPTDRVIDVDILDLPRLGKVTLA